MSCDYCGVTSNTMDGLRETNVSCLRTLTHGCGWLPVELLVTMLPPSACHSWFVCTFCLPGCCQAHARLSTDRRSQSLLRFKGQTKLMEWPAVPGPAGADVGVDSFSLLHPLCNCCPVAHS